MTTPRTPSEHVNRRAALRWGGFVVGLLGLQVAGGIAAIILASGDESVAVVPNYHQKALNWDREIALRDASSRLGWRANMAVLTRRSGSGNTTGGLQVTLVDKQGQPVAIEAAAIEWYRHVRAGQVQRATAPPSLAGVIDLQACFDAEGLWQVSLDVRDAEGNRFVLSREIEVDWGLRPRDGEAT